MSAVAIQSIDSVQEVYARLIAAARQNDPLGEILARMLASRLNGYGAMPEYFGLDEAEFRQLLSHYFPYFNAPVAQQYTRPDEFQRSDEVEDLRTLLQQNCSTPDQPGRWIIDIVIAGCLGSDHLWQDLGLWCRDDLSKLMRDNFAPLAELNNKDMKWKKFLYKQLCEAEGVYTCRAPSCEVCKDYQDCFGPED